MGNSDPESISVKAIKAVQHINLGIHLDIILGSMNKLNEVFFQDQLKDYKGSWKIHRNIKNIATLMKKADLAICNNGLTRYELASLGIPTIFLSNNQKDVQFSDLFASFGCAHHLGWHKNLTSKDVANEVVSLIQNFNTRKNMSHRGKKLIDGDGVERVFREIMIK